MTNIEFDHDDDDSLDHTPYDYDDLLAGTIPPSVYAASHVGPYIRSVCAAAHVVQAELVRRKRLADNSVDVTAKALAMIGERFEALAPHVVITQTLHGDLVALHGYDYHLALILAQAVTDMWLMSTTQLAEGITKYGVAHSRVVDDRACAFYTSACLVTVDDVKTIIIDRSESASIGSNHWIRDHAEPSVLLPLAHSQSIAITVWPTNTIAQACSTDDWAAYVSLRGVEIGRPVTLDRRDTRSGAEMVEACDESGNWEWVEVSIGGVPHRARLINPGWYWRRVDAVAQ